MNAEEAPYHAPETYDDAALTIPFPSGYTEVDGLLRGLTNDQGELP